MSGDYPILKALFERCLDVDPAAREAWIVREVADPAQRATLRAMLAADAAPGALIGESIDRRIDQIQRRAAEPADPGAQVGQRVGAFRLVSLLGRGGQGAVYLAEREDGGFGQRVAIKLLHRWLDGPDQQRRFRRERELLARFEHPGIARLVDGGVTREGTPFLAMEYVDGVRLDVHCARDAMPLRRRLACFARLLAVIADAHRALIVHRDLKPANILVTADGLVKVLDFGIARLLDDDDASRVLALTPGYCAPEQRLGQRITAATDVHALGVILRELATGVGPAVDTGAPMPTWPDDVPAEVRWIVERACAAEPHDRYRDAAAMAEDVANLLEDRPVVAHPPSAWYRARKFVARHRGGVTLTALLLTTTLVGGVTTVWQAQRASLEARRATLVRDFLEQLFVPLDDGRPADRTPTLAELAAAGAARLDADASLDAATRVDLLLMFSRLEGHLGEDDDSIRLARSAHALAEAELAPSEPLAVQAVALLGMALVRAEALAEAEPLLLDARRRLLDDANDPALLADVVGFLGIAAARRGDWDAQLAYKREALDRHIALHGADSVEAGEAYNNLGAALDFRGRFDEAVAAYEKAMAIRRALDSADHYGALTTRSNLGEALRLQGHVARAEAELAAVAQGLERIDGDSRFLRVRNAQRLCETCRLGDDVAAAARSCADMLATAERVAGRSTIEYGVALLVDAQRQVDLGDFAAARGEIEAADRLFVDPLRHRSLRAGSALVAAQVAWFSGDAAGAREAAATAAEILADEPRLGVKRTGALAIQALACAAAPATACPGDLERRLASALAAQRDNDHPSLVLARIAAGRLALSRGDVAAARAMLADAARNAARELGRDHPLREALGLWEAAARSASPADCATVAAPRHVAAAGLHPVLAEARSGRQPREACADAGGRR